MAFIRRSPEKAKLQVVVDAPAPSHNSLHQQRGGGTGGARQNHAKNDKTGHYPAGTMDHNERHHNSKICTMAVFLRQRRLLWIRAGAFFALAALMLLLAYAVLASIPSDQPLTLSPHLREQKSGGGGGGGDGPWRSQRNGNTEKEESAKAQGVPRYYELADEIKAALQDVNLEAAPHRSAFVKATTIQRADPWFTPQKICHETCCAETVAISLHQDKHHIVNTITGWDLADTLVKEYPDQPWQNSIEVFAEPSLNEDLLPCLQPGTIIHLDNHVHIINYFWRRLRPNIDVPYVLISGESDSDNPDRLTDQVRNLMTDPLLIKWYGTNPNLSIAKKLNSKDKFEPFPLGLSKHHPQSPRLSAYLELTGFANPFWDKTRWTSRFGKKKGLAHSSRAPGNANDDDKIFSEYFFVMFAVHEHAKHRQALFDGLCQNWNRNSSSSSSSSSNNYSTENISCVYAPNGQTVLPHDVYGAASKYLFGVSPPGNGWDCYRTYELLLLGVIPIIQERPGSRELFQDLPVIHVPYLTDFHHNGEEPSLLPPKNWTRSELVQIARDYVQSDTFLQSNFTGWDRLFLKYWRRKILKETGRDTNILQDETGREYYQAWRYTRVIGGDENKPLYCSDKGKCLS